MYWLKDCVAYLREHWCISRTVIKDRIWVPYWQAVQLMHELKRLWIIGWVDADWVRCREGFTCEDCGDGKNKKV